jgi:riboflavin kinase/FMN adenylyltransferase
MKIYRGINEISEPLKQPVLTIGNFDGVHIGHAEVIEKVVNRAKEIGGTSVVIVFDPHPRTFFSPENPQKLISTMEQRIDIFQELGVDVVIVQPFNQEFASLDANLFIEEYLAGKLNLEEIHVSSKFRFGKGAMGTIQLLEDLADKYGYTVETTENQFFRHTVVSSTFIRNLILEGEMELARFMLGRPYTIYGNVYPDTQRGTNLLNTPTSNVTIENELIPSHGIYAGAITLPEGRYPAATYIGTRPTFEGDKLVVESHILGFSGNLYGERLGVELFKKIREDKKFEHLHDLLAQIQLDVEHVREYLQRHVEDPQLGHLIWK